MKIVVIGAGKTGSQIVEGLVAEGHAVTVLDKDPRRAERIGNELDVLSYAGNGASIAALRGAEAQHAELLIAMAESDEVNLLCCIVAKRMGIPHTIARIRNPEYFEQLPLMREDLALSLVVNPEKITADEIARVLLFPSASQVELFAKGRAEIVACKLPAESPAAGKTLIEWGKITGARILVCAVQRGDGVIIPRGDFAPCAGDKLFITGATGDMARAFRKLGLFKSRAKACILVGGGRIGYYLAKRLCAENVSVKLLERDAAQAEHMAELLPAATILHADAGDYGVLLEEGLGNTDALVAITGTDEINILTGLYASRQNVPKVVVKINADGLAALADEAFAKLDSIVSPKRLAAEQVIAYVRALSAAVADEKIISVVHIADGGAEISEFVAAQSAPYLHIPLKEMKIRRNILLAGIIRGSKVIIPGGETCIEPGDIVLVCAAGQRIRRLREILV
ncbi:MAG: Trk system potassium transporter TrkA [Clostridiales bacterium]|nr:Trk system potassium transporter TrkA [Clostridiales bacterium]